MANQTSVRFMVTAGGTASVVATVTKTSDAADALGFHAPQPRNMLLWFMEVRDPDNDFFHFSPDDIRYPQGARPASPAGLHVRCKKPITDAAGQTYETAEPAKTTHQTTAYSDAFAHIQLHYLAKEITTVDESDEVKMFGARQQIEMNGNPLVLSIWHANRKPAAVDNKGDTGTHGFSQVDFLVSGNTELITNISTLTPPILAVNRSGNGDRTRLTCTEQWSDVADPNGSRILYKFSDGARRLVDFSQGSTGRKANQISGTRKAKGSLSDTFEKANCLRSSPNADAIGHRRAHEIIVTPRNETLSAFRLRANSAFGYIKWRHIETEKVSRSMPSGRPMWPTFGARHNVAPMVDTCRKASILGLGFHSRNAVEDA